MRQHDDDFQDDGSAPIDIPAIPVEPIHHEEPIQLPFEHHDAPVEPIYHEAAPIEPAHAIEPTPHYLPDFGHVAEPLPEPPPEHTLPISYEPTHHINPHLMEDTEPVSYPQPYFPDFMQATAPSEDDYTPAQPIKVGPAQEPAAEPTEPAHAAHNLIAVDYSSFHLAPAEPDTANVHTQSGPGGGGDDFDGGNPNDHGYEGMSGVDPGSDMNSLRQQSSGDFINSYQYEPPQMAEHIEYSHQPEPVQHQEQPAQEQNVQEAAPVYEVAIPESHEAPPQQHHEDYSIASQDPGNQWESVQQMDVGRQSDPANQLDHGISQFELTHQEGHATSIAVTDNLIHDQSSSSISHAWDVVSDQATKELGALQVLAAASNATVAEFGRLSPEGIAAETAYFSASDSFLKTQELLERVVNTAVGAQSNGQAGLEGVITAAATNTLWHIGGSYDQGQGQGQSTGSGYTDSDPGNRLLDFAVASGAMTMQQAFGGMQGQSLAHEMSTEYQAPLQVGHFANPNYQAPEVQPTQTEYSETPQQQETAQTQPEQHYSAPVQEAAPAGHQQTQAEIEQQQRDEYSGRGGNSWAGVAGGEFDDGMDNSGGDSPMDGPIGSSFTSGGNFVMPHTDNYEGSGPTYVEPAHVEPTHTEPVANAEAAPEGHSAAHDLIAVDNESISHIAVEPLPMLTEIAHGEPVAHTDASTQPTTPYFSGTRDLGGDGHLATDVSKAIDTAAMAPADHIQSVHEMAAADPTLLQPYAAFTTGPKEMGEHAATDKYGSIIGALPIIETTPVIDALVHPNYNNISHEPLAAVNVTVQAGDSLERIAARNGTTTAEILSMNPDLAAHPNQLQPGQEVSVQPWSIYDHSNDANKSFGQVVQEARLRGETTVSFNGQSYATFTNDEIKAAGAKLIDQAGANLSADGKHAVESTVLQNIAANAYIRTAQGAQQGNVAVVTDGTVKLAVSEAGVQASFDRTNNSLESSIKATASNGLDTLIKDATTPAPVVHAPDAAANYQAQINSMMDGGGDVPGGKLASNLVNAAIGFAQGSEALGKQAGDYLRSHTPGEVLNDAMNAITPKSTGESNSFQSGNPMGDFDGSTVDTSKIPTSTMSYSEQMSHVKDTVVKVADVLVVEPIKDAGHALSDLVSRDLTPDEAIRSVGSVAMGVITVAPFVGGAVKAVGAGSEFISDIRTVVAASEAMTEGAAARAAAEAAGSHAGQAFTAGVDGIYDSQGLAKAESFVGAPGSVAGEFHPTPVAEIPRLEGPTSSVPFGTEIHPADVSVRQVVELPNGNIGMVVEGQSGLEIRVAQRIEDTEKYQISTVKLDSIEGNVKVVDPSVTPPTVISRSEVTPIAYEQPGHPTPAPAAVDNVIPHSAEPAGVGSPIHVELEHPPIASTELSQGSQSLGAQVAENLRPADGMQIGHPELTQDLLQLAPKFTDSVLADAAKLPAAEAAASRQAAADFLQAERNSLIDRAGLTPQEWIDKAAAEMPGLKGYGEVYRTQVATLDEQIARLEGHVAEAHVPIVEVHTPVIEAHAPVVEAHPPAPIEMPKVGDTPSAQALESVQKNIDNPINVSEKFNAIVENLHGKGIDVDILTRAQMKELTGNPSAQAVSYIDDAGVPRIALNKSMTPTERYESVLHELSHSTDDLNLLKNKGTGSIEITSESGSMNIPVYENFVSVGEFKSHAVQFAAEKQILGTYLATGEIENSAIVVGRMAETIEIRAALQAEIKDSLPRVSEALSNPANIKIEEAVAGHERIVVTIQDAAGLPKEVSFPAPAGLTTSEAIPYVRTAIDEAKANVLINDANLAKNIDEFNAFKQLINEAKNPAPHPVEVAVPTTPGDAPISLTPPKDVAYTNPGFKTPEPATVDAAPSVLHSQINTEMPISLAPVETESFAAVKAESGIADVSHPATPAVHAEIHPEPQISLTPVEQPHTVTTAVHDIRDQYLDDVLTPSQYSDAVVKLAHDQGLPDAAVKALGRMDEFTLDNVMTASPEKLFDLLKSSNPEVAAYAQHLVENSVEIGADKFSLAVKQIEKLEGLPTHEGVAVPLNHGSGGVGDIFAADLDGKSVIIKADRDARVSIDSELKVLDGLKDYGGPESYGRVRLVDPATGVWREGVAMERVQGEDLLTVIRELRNGETPSVVITDVHIKAFDNLESTLAANGKHLADTNLGDFMMTNDVRRPLIPLDMQVTPGVIADEGMRATVGGGEGYQLIRDYLIEARDLSSARAIHEMPAPIKAGPGQEFHVTVPFETAPISLTPPTDIAYTTPGMKTPVGVVAESAPSLMVHTSPIEHSSPISTIAVGEPSPAAVHVAMPGHIEASTVKLGASAASHDVQAMHDISRPVVSTHAQAPVENTFRVHEIAPDISIKVAATETSHAPIHPSITHVALDQVTGSLKVASANDNLVMIVGKNGHVTETTSHQAAVHQLSSGDQIFTVAKHAVERFSDNGRTGLQAIKEMISQSHREGLQTEEIAQKLKTSTIGHALLDDHSITAMQWRPAQAKAHKKAV